ncbi:MFS transporter [Chitinophaga nivalis]|uniref:MFS transporter n=1 Tax=Chitinophaga nivalis TaxID=2991709 RepID=A0ABT3IMQ3_9BACT|nr:MFS transporter [Chitinophaga nivalis]MCW3465090.1 MFS transporter [Chitinophaga nivalis]MCW3485218.1 MFS transporter [Chitinophaga nivalis]
MSELSKAGSLAILLTSCLTIMVGTAIAPSLNIIAPRLHVTTLATWLITLPSLGVVLCAPLAGWWIDRKGPHTVMKWGLAAYGLLGVAPVFLHTPGLILANRLLLGGATAAVMASGTALLAIFFQGQARLRMLAIQGMAIELGGVLFLLLGGALGETDWRLPFMIYLFAWCCLLLFLCTVPAVRATAAIGDVPTPASRSMTKPVRLIVAGAVIAMGLFFTAIVGIPAFLFKDFGYTASQTGYYMGAVSLIAVLAAGLLTGMVKRLTATYTLITGFGLLALGHLLLYHASNLPGLALAAICLGGGFGFTVPLLNHLMVEESTAANRGRNLGYYSMAIFGGQFLSSFMELFTGSSRMAFLAAAIAGTGVTLLLLLNQRRYLSQK